MLTNHLTGSRQGLARGGGALAAALALLLAACAAPEVRYEPVEIRVPVVVPCAVEAPAEPAWAVDALPPGADEFQIAKALRAARRQRQQYVAELKAAMLGCTQPKGATP